MELTVFKLLRNLYLFIRLIVEINRGLNENLLPLIQGVFDLYIYFIFCESALLERYRLLRINEKFKFQ